MNKLKKLIKDCSNAINGVDYSKSILSWEELLVIHNLKIHDIEIANNVILPTFVKDALIDAFWMNKNKLSFIEAKNLKKKATVWLLENNIISLIYVTIRGKPSIYKINNMPMEYKSYEKHLDDMFESYKQITEKVFSEGMKIFN